MDTRDICTGSTLYLPVFQEGAQLAMGDVHAAMGDGEICGTGVECSAEVLVRVSLQKDMKLKRPLLITSTEVQAIASAQTADEAAKLAIGDLVSYIMRQNKLSFNDAYMLASVMGNARISQLVDPLITVRMGIAKELISF